MLAEGVCMCDSPLPPPLPSLPPHTHITHHSLAEGVNTVGPCWILLATPPLSISLSYTTSTSLASSDIEFFTSADSISSGFMNREYGLM